MDYETVLLRLILLISNCEKLKDIVIGLRVINYIIDYIIIWIS